MSTSQLQRYDRLGRGLGQPLHPDAQHRLPVVQGPEKVRQAISTVLRSSVGDTATSVTLMRGSQRASADSISR